MPPPSLVPTVVACVLARPTLALQIGYLPQTASRASLSMILDPSLLRDVAFYDMQKEMEVREERDGQLRDQRVKAS